MVNTKTSVNFWVIFPRHGKNKGAILRYFSDSVPLENGINCLSNDLIRIDRVSVHCIKIREVSWSGQQ